MKAIKTIVNKAFINGVATAFSGSHCFKCVPGNPEVVFYYHGNPVCVVNLHARTFALDHCGFDTSSTTRTLNAYRDELIARGFTCSQVK